MVVELQTIKSLLEKYEQVREVAQFEFRPKQLSVEPLNPAAWRIARSVLTDIISHMNFSGIQMVESSHSIDVIAPGVSKMNLVKFCQEVSYQVGNPNAVLCIGDKGEWPGNDYELLSTPYSISVDTVSPNPESCWNLNPKGHLNVQATLAHLRNMNILDKTIRFRFQDR